MISHNNNKFDHCGANTIPFISLGLQDLGDDIVLLATSGPLGIDQGVQPSSVPRTRSDYSLRPGPRPFQRRAVHRRTNPISFIRDHPPSLDLHTFPSAPYTGQREQSVFVALGLPPEEETRMNLPAERYQYELGSYDDPWIRANIRKSSFYNCEDNNFELHMMFNDGSWMNFGTH